MEEKMLRTLATLVLPSQILDYFTIVSVCEVGPEFHISLDERMDKTLSGNATFESKGFMEAVNITDFPIRGHKVILKIRRRRWTDLRT
ncbi:ISAon1 family transposase N-terminal region protein, partial [Prevotella corporis]